jgi:uncharacterized protein
MLIEFKVKNFRSFKDEAVLSMVASADKNLPENSSVVGNFGKRRVLHSAVIFGANAAGKTNLITAAAFVDGFINSCTERKVGEPIEVQPFLLSDHPNNKPSEFELTFISEEGIRYQYGFHINSKQVISEWLVAYPKGLPQTWYEREINQESESEYDWSFGRNLKGQNSQISKLCRPDVLFLSMAAKLNHKQLGNVFNWFRKGIYILNSKDLSPAHTVKFIDKLKDPTWENIIRQFLNSADLGISGFKVQKQNFKADDLPEGMPIELKNMILNQPQSIVTIQHKIRDNKEVYLPLEQESMGTQQLFALSVPLNSMLMNGRTLFIDELDASLHPLLVKYIIKLFHNPITNPKGAQLIFNTHDTTIMDQEIFRRDQIWFVEKDEDGCSHLYSLLEYSPRNKEALSKNYLQGRYGSIPFIED